MADRRQPQQEPTLRMRRSARLTQRRAPMNRAWPGGVMFVDPYTGVSSSIIYEDDVYEEGVYQ